MPYAQQNPDYKKLRKHALQKMDLVGVLAFRGDGLSSFIFIVLCHRNKEPKY